MWNWGWHQGVTGEGCVGEMGPVPVVRFWCDGEHLDFREFLESLYLQEALTQFLILKVSVFRANTQVWL